MKTGEIKFRAWQKNHKKMCFVPQIEWRNGEITHVMFDNGENCAPRFSTYGLKDWPLDCVELMQFTGMRDKKRTDDYPKGEEIYEDSIVKLTVEYSITESMYEDGGDFKFTHYGVVKYLPSIGFYLDVFKSFDEYNGEWCKEFPKRKEIVQYRSEVIGNIHQNPELLKL